jgi:hypothetical protein
MKKLLLLLTPLFFPFALFSQNHCLHFDGVDDYINAGDDENFQITDEMTLEVWINPSSHSMPGDAQIIANKEGEFVLAIYPNGTLRWAVANTNPGWSFTNSGVTIPLNTWTHITMTYNEGTTIIYINGIQEHVHNGSGIIGDIIPDRNDFMIGWRGTFTDQPFMGYIDEFRFWNVARQVTEIQASWNRELTGCEAGLIAYYKLDNTSGNVAWDCSMPFLDGQLVGISGSQNAPQYANNVPLITDAACCQQVSIPDDLSDREVKVYPNPSHGKLLIEAPGGSIQTLQLYDVRGRKIEALISSHSDAVLLSTSYSGLAFVRIQFTDGVIVRKVLFE